MSVLLRLYTRVPGATIQSAQENAEFSQIIDALSGVSTTKNLVVKYNHATDPPLALDQTGTGFIEQWKLAGSEVARVNNNGSFRTVQQFISTLAIGTKPIDVTSTTLCTNLNADAVDGLHGTQFVRNDIAASATLIDSTSSFVDDGDNSKVLKFQCSTISTATTRTWTIPDFSDTLVGLTGTQTLTNKKFTDANCTFVDDGDATKQLAFQCSGITTGNTRTWTVPDASSTLVGTDTTQTLTNKTLTSPRIGTSLLDTSGNEYFDFTPGASAVNQIGVFNTATGFPPGFASAGGDTNIGIFLASKGTGDVTLGAAPTPYVRVQSSGRVLTRAGNGSTVSSDEIAFSGLYATGVPAATPGSGTVTTTLKTVAANVMGRDGDYFEVWVSGTSSGANSKEVLLNINGNDVVSTGPYTGLDAWWIHAFLRRDSSTNFDAFGTVLRNGFGTQKVGEFFSSSWDFTTTWTIAIKTILTTAGQVSINRFIVVKHTTPA